MDCKQFLASFLIFVALASNLIGSSSAARPAAGQARSSAGRAAVGQVSRNTEFVRTSCSSTTYPSLCFSSLASHATAIQLSPKLLANAALSVTLDSARTTSDNMVKLSQTHGLQPREVAAMRDCVEELRDSVDEIRKSMAEMNQFKSGSTGFGLMINDVQTWVSSALTDEDTCTDGFAGKSADGSVKTEVRAQIVNVAHMTSNALALINSYASLHG